jgi:hypothetical protein
VLAPAERAETRWLCDGEVALAILLLRTKDPAPTATCPSGVTTVQIGGDLDGDEDLARDEIAVAFQSCAASDAPVLPPPAPEEDEWSAIARLAPDDAIVFARP